MPRRYRQKWLHREIELGAKSSANSRGNDAHKLWRNGENGRDIVSVHVRRLGTCLNLDGIADTPCESGFGLDVGMLYEPRFVLGFDHDFGRAQRLVDIAAHDPSPYENVFGAVLVDQICPAR